MIPRRTFVTLLGATSAAEHRRKILSANPARLCDFPQSSPLP